MKLNQGTLVVFAAFVPLIPRGRTGPPVDRGFVQFDTPGYRAVRVRIDDPENDCSFAWFLRSELKVPRRRMPA